MEPLALIHQEKETFSMTKRKISKSRREAEKVFQACIDQTNLIRHKIAFCAFSAIKYSYNSVVV